MITVIATDQYGNKAKATISRSLMDRFMDLIKGNAINPYTKKKLPAQRVYVNVNGDPKKSRGNLKRLDLCSNLYTMKRTRG